MWLMSYITGNSINAPNAFRGSVSNSGSNVSVAASGEHKALKTCLPYGVVSVPPAGQRAVVLPLDDGEVSLGVIAENAGLEPGELMLSSKGGATIILKNSGKVIINGKEF